MPPSEVRLRDARHAQLLESCRCDGGAPKSYLRRLAAWAEVAGDYRDSLARYLARYAAACAAGGPSTRPDSEELA